MTPSFNPSKVFHIMQISIMSDGMKFFIPSPGKSKDSSSISMGGNGKGGFKHLSTCSLRSFLKDLVRFKRIGVFRMVLIKVF